MRSRLCARTRRVPQIRRVRESHWFRSVRESHWFRSVRESHWFLEAPLAETSLRGKVETRKEKSESHVFLEEYMRFRLFFTRFNFSTQTRFRQRRLEKPVGLPNATEPVGLPNATEPVGLPNSTDLRDPPGTGAKSGSHVFLEEYMRFRLFQRISTFPRKLVSASGASRTLRLRIRGCRWKVRDLKDIGGRNWTRLGGPGGNPRI